MVDKSTEIYWEKKGNEGLLIFYIVTAFIFFGGMAFGAIGTKWVLTKNRIEACK